VRDLNSPWKALDITLINYNDKVPDIYYKIPSSAFFTISKKTFLIRCMNSRLYDNRDWLLHSFLTIYDLNNYILFVTCLNLSNRNSSETVSIKKYLDEKGILQVDPCEFLDYRLYGLNYEVLKL